MNKKNNIDIEFILVEPSHPGNIGACARAIKNMGFEIKGKRNDIILGTTLGLFIMALD